MLSKRRRNFGMTLVELLVVIGIGVILLAIVAPVFRNNVGEQKVRETTRMVQAYVAKAQATAAQTRRPVGVWLERLSNDVTVNAPGTLTCVQMFIAETPPPYTGDLIDSTCMLRDMNYGQGIDGEWGVANVDDDGNGSVDDFNERGWLDSDDGDGMPETASFNTAIHQSFDSLVNVGDFIRFDHRSLFFTITNKTVISANEIDVTIFHPNTIWTASPAGPVWASPPAPQSATSLLSFQIYRRPERALAEPLNLPTGACIDLSASGFGNSGVEFSAISPAIANGPILIMFTPSGAVSSVGGIGLASGPPQSDIHLMIGTPDKVNPPNIVAWDERDNPTNALTTRNEGEEALSNIMAGNESRWVTIGHRNGMVGTTENFFVTPVMVSVGGVFVPNVLQAVADARTYAITGRTTGGR
ncbi:MAG: type II secretion system protein [Pirellulaceae bacterium]|jgi:prepilin-type N-terminal cleavage/methylation domain-containing protein|nr:type II secretion system protein [Pirellulaceae bacterium]MDP7019037.1 type II secretion system protein [Pirellulaceae bacterium]